MTRGIPMAAPRKDNVKEKILQAASALLKKETVANISLSSIAKEAGISKGTLYYYYQYREDLLFDIADRYFNEQYNELFTWANNTAKDTSFPRLFKYILERDIHDPTLRFQMLYAAAEGNAPLREKLIDRYTHFQKAISRLIQERLPKEDANYLSWLALLVSDGMIVQMEIKNSAFDPNKFIKDTEHNLKQFFPTNN